MQGKSPYISGFGNYFESEAVAGALPVGQNSPQKVPFNLYAEQLSGSAFTAPRPRNLRSWLYRIRPSVVHGAFSLYQQATARLTTPTPPDQLRWQPLPYPQQPTDFIHGSMPYASNGSASNGATVQLYAINQSMTNSFFYHADADLLIVPQEGGLHFKTEFGNIDIVPNEIIVIPRGIKFQVHLAEQCARGYICENHGAPFILPDLGPIGANGLANPRDFLTPVAAYEQRQEDFTLLVKFQGHLWQSHIGHSPLDVVAWHGNYVPYKYDLTRFCTINTVSYDHPDPSIFTVLTSPSAVAGTANVDFVIFPERWMVAEHTFRPPYFHRNIMSEFMGLIHGHYDAKSDGFMPGGCSIHNAFAAHGPDTETYQKAIANTELKPTRYRNTLAFMFESQHIWQPSEYAMQAKHRAEKYQDCWQGLQANFSLSTGS